MEMNMKKIVCILAALVISACSTTATMYPVEGPYFDNNKVQGIDAKIDGIMSNSGDLSVTLPDGESLSGKWSVVAPQSVSSSWGTLFTQYGSISGSNSVVTTKAGANKGTAYLVGEKGTTMDVEFTVGSGTASGNGFGKDSNGNVYKIIF